jgi:hypothetical protein
LTYEVIKRVTNRENDFFDSADFDSEHKKWISSAIIEWSNEGQEWLIKALEESFKLGKYYVKGLKREICIYYTTCSVMWHTKTYVIKRNILKWIKIMLDGSSDHCEIQFWTYLRQTTRMQTWKLIYLLYEYCNNQ